MTAVVYSVTEAPIILEDIIAVDIDENTMTITNHQGRLPIDMTEAVRVEFSDD